MMAGLSVGLIIEALVALLLAVSIGYCVVLDRRLQRIRLNEDEMRRTILELGAATERAERAIETLRDAVHDCDRTLADRLRQAERQSGDLVQQIRAGSEVLSRISRIVAVGKGGVAA
ncbi:MAG TPA: DUF6468 domain-containing protein [Beijerinckiaceae bacterium]|nr:DUF6468 domain-containing protein [Beijerinckiaceae bacterium]